MELTRRMFLGVLAAPAIIRVAPIMPISVLATEREVFTECVLSIGSEVSDEPLFIRSKGGDIVLTENGNLRLKSGRRILRAGEGVEFRREGNIWIEVF